MLSMWLAAEVHVDSDSKVLPGLESVVWSMWPRGRLALSEGAPGLSWLWWQAASRDALVIFWLH